MVIVSSNVLEVFDGFNFSHHQLPKLYRESERRLLKKVMSFFVKSPSNRNLKDLTKTTQQIRSLVCRWQYCCPYSSFEFKWWGKCCSLLVRHLQLMCLISWPFQLRVSLYNFDLIQDSMMNATKCEFVLNVIEDIKLQKELEEILAP